MNKVKFLQNRKTSESKCLKLILSGKDIISSSNNINLNNIVSCTFSVHPFDQHYLPVPIL